jgi:Predicted transcriptional regulators
MEFKDRIRDLRTERGMTQTQLAAVLNKSDSAVRMWETGRSKPDADTAIKLSKMFNCSMDYLFGLTDNTTHENVNISDEFGLNDRSIKTLRYINKHKKGKKDNIINIINLLIAECCNIDYAINLKDTEEIYRITSVLKYILDYFNKKTNREYIVFYVDGKIELTNPDIGDSGEPDYDWIDFHDFLFKYYMSRIGHHLSELKGDYIRLLKQQGNEDGNDSEA